MAVTKQLAANGEEYIIHQRQINFVSFRASFNYNRYGENAYKYAHELEKFVSNIKSYEKGTTKLAEYKELKLSLVNSWEIEIDNLKIQKNGEGKESYVIQKKVRSVVFMAAFSVNKYGHDKAREMAREALIFINQIKKSDDLMRKRYEFDTIKSDIVKRAEKVEQITKGTQTLYRYDDQYLTVSEISRLLEIPDSTVRYKLERGKSFYQIIKDNKKIRKRNGRYSKKVKMEDDLNFNPYEGLSQSQINALESGNNKDLLRG